MEAIKTLYNKYKIWVHLGGAVLGGLLLWRMLKK